MNNDMDLGHRIKQAAAKASARDGKMLDLPNAEESYYKFLYYLAVSLWPKKIIELGVYRGTGLAHLALGALFSIVIGVDIDLTKVDPKVAAMRRLRLVESDSVDYLSRMADNSMASGLFHLDTIHTPAQVQAELDQVVRVATSPAVVCVDDINIDAAMIEWWDQIPYRKLEFPDLHATGYGVIIL